MADRIVTAFAPATVANVTCGFDVLGFAVEPLGDRVTARRAGEGVAIESIEGDHGRLPREAARNTAGVAATALLRLRRQAGEDSGGVVLSVEKGMPLASGLGSSAASAVAAVTAVDALFDSPSPPDRLLRAAMEAERVACGTAHADNVAPALFGGLVMVRGDEPQVDVLDVHPDYWVAVVHPHLEVSTSDARSVLPASVPIGDAVLQAGNLAALVTGLARGDNALVAGALVDRIGEPVRTEAVPGFAATRAAAMDAGALGGGLSGSGSSQFAIARGREVAERVADRMQATVRTEARVEADAFVSRLGVAGARIVEERA